MLVLGSNATGNRIAGNLIGTNSAGASTLGNVLDGLIVNAVGRQHHRRDSPQGHET